MAFLKVADLNSYYGQSHVLYDVSLSTEAGGLVALIGRNGAPQSDPDLLLIDEPTEGLMSTLVDELASILTRINADGTTMLLVEQNVDLALSIGDYTHILDEGKISFEGRESETVRENQEMKDRYLTV